MNTRAPPWSACATYPAAPGSGKKVAVCRQSGVRVAKSAAQALSQAAMPGLCGYSIEVNARTPNSRSSRTRSASSRRYVIGQGRPVSGPAASKYAHTLSRTFWGMKWVCTSIRPGRPRPCQNARTSAVLTRAPAWRAR